MSFYYLDQNINSVNSPFENFGFNDKKFNLENFESMPPVDKENSDGSYQCSDNVQITGNAIGSSIPNTTLSNCKSECKAEGSCVGFDFDNSSSSCTLKNTITDLTSTKQNNVMCVKKTSSACKVTPQVDPAIEAETIINGNSEQETKSGPKIPPGIIIPPVPPTPMPGPVPTPPTPTPIPAPYNPVLPPVPPVTKPIPKPIAPLKSDTCKADTIFVDLPCFLNKMDVLKNHSDNLMIDLQLLITNLKSCSYVKKLNKKRPSSNNPLKSINSTNSDSDDDLTFGGNFSFGGSNSSQSESTTSTVSNSNLPVVMPTQDTIKVYNSQASVLYTNNPSNNANVMLGLTEPFESSEQQQSSFYTTFTFKLIVLILVLVLIMKI